MVEQLLGESHEHYKKGLSHGQANKKALRMWQRRLERAESMPNFLRLWAPDITVHPEIEIPRTPGQRQTAPVSAIIGEATIQQLSFLPQNS